MKEHQVSYESTEIKRNKQLCTCVGGKGVPHFIHHLAPKGTAGFVLANGSMSSNQSGEGDIRKALIEADLVDCMVALPGQLFYSTPIPNIRVEKLSE